MMVVAPLELENCVSAPEATLRESVPSACPLTVTLGIGIDEPVGDAKAPLALKIKFVPVLIHAEEPVAEVLLA